MKTLDAVYPGLWTSSKLLVIVFIIMFLSHIVACAWYQVRAVHRRVCMLSGRVEQPFAIASR